MTDNTLYIAQTGARDHYGPGPVIHLSDTSKPYLRELYGVPADIAWDVPGLPWRQWVMSWGRWLDECQRWLFDPVFARIGPGELLYDTPLDRYPHNKRDWVPSGATLVCPCFKEVVKAGRCHRVWLARALVLAGWTVIFDGEELLHPGIFREVAHG